MTTYQNQYKQVTEELDKIIANIENIKLKAKHDITSATTPSEKAKLFKDYKSQMLEFKSDKILKDRYYDLKKTQTRLKKMMDEHKSISMTSSISQSSCDIVTISLSKQNIKDIKILYNCLLKLKKDVTD